MNQHFSLWQQRTLKTTLKGCLQCMFQMRGMRMRSHHRQSWSLYNDDHCREVREESEIHHKHFNSYGRLRKLHLTGIIQEWGKETRWLSSAAANRQQILTGVCVVRALMSTGTWTHELRSASAGTTNSKDKTKPMTLLACNGVWVNICICAGGGTVCVLFCIYLEPFAV